MDFIAAFFRLVDQYGLTDALKIVAFLVTVSIIFGLFRRWNRIALSNAASRHRTEKADAENSISLSQSIREMAQSNNETVRATMESMRAAESERSKQLAVLTDMTGQIRGIGLTLSDESKARKMISASLHELEDKLSPLTTHVQDINVRTAGMEASFVRVLDERVGPMMSLMINISARINDLTVMAQSNGGVAGNMMTETTLMNAQIAQLLVDFSLLKDMIFDRDDRISDILKASLSNSSKDPS